MDDNLLIRFLTNRCSPDELQQIDRWISSDRTNTKWLFEIEQTWMLKDQMCFSDQQTIKQAYNRFVSRKAEKRRFFNVQAQAGEVVRFGVTKIHHCSHYHAVAFFKSVPDDAK
jgi:uncharacterized protein